MPCSTGRPVQAGGCPVRYLPTAAGVRYLAFSGHKRGPAVVREGESIPPARPWRTASSTPPYTHLPLSHMHTCATRCYVSHLFFVAGLPTRADTPRVVKASRSICSVFAYTPFRRAQVGIGRLTHEPAVLGCELILRFVRNRGLRPRHDLWE